MSQKNNRDRGGGRQTGAGRVVILIFAHKEKLEWHEQISLAQCARVLEMHPTRLVCPDGMDTRAYRQIVPNIRVDPVEPHWLSSYRAYNRFKLHPELYRRYTQFEFILTHELDAFVFRDDLLYWCDQGWDYIGAPWFEGYYHAQPGAAPAGVGNSGFSLRKTESALKVLRSWACVEPAADVFARGFNSPNFPVRGPLSAVKHVLLGNRFHSWLNDFEENEDLFWGLHARKRLGWFKVAPHEVARQFSFEMEPARLLRENGGKLPFGCHKWHQLALEFWWPWIEAHGYQRPPCVPAAACRVTGDADRVL